MRVKRCSPERKSLSTEGSGLRDQLGADTGVHWESNEGEDGGGSRGGRYAEYMRSKDGKF